MGHSPVPTPVGVQRGRGQILGAGSAPPRPAQQPWARAAQTPWLEGGQEAAPGTTTPRGPRLFPGAGRASGGQAPMLPSWLREPCGSRNCTTGWHVSSLNPKGGRSCKLKHRPTKRACWDSWVPAPPGHPCVQTARGTGVQVNGAAITRTHSHTHWRTRTHTLWAWGRAAI